jgi:enolase
LSEVISKLEAGEILSGPGRPTVEVRLETSRGVRVRASVASGTSKGDYEAFEIHDGGVRFRGFGVRNAVDNVNRVIAPAVRGMEVTQQERIDRKMIDLDGTPNKGRLGANAILPVSVAAVKAGAESVGLPVYRYLGGLGRGKLPVPLATVLAGGEHSVSGLEFEDYLLIPGGFSTFADAVEALYTTRLSLGEILRQRLGPIPEIGGALAPPLSDTREAFDLMLTAVERAGYGGKIQLGLDVAASQFYDKKAGVYRLSQTTATAEELIPFYARLAGDYPLVFIEDPFHQDDFRHFALLRERLPGKMIVGDDLFASSPKRLARGIQERAGNMILLKVNQIGTVCEACETAVLASQNGFGITVSVRSNDTNDSFIADFGVAVGAQKIKLGSPVRGERNSKYNRLLEIEEELNNRA